ncbi:L,D-transpeptidase family protein [Pelagibacterium halotolerans]|uniref:L,D-transpeptidase YcbB n=1 Tax=Pelagibacterium halotolerans (strain DSM 22347 / JCM 15775 / CGMCC 1.7692 / B2) TaxID=1082931 RepID=G4R9Z2_PELHB|nr:L,D-transpeptidase family protein [Pelagibacterium halotolerans]AEQ52519.1 L,D-transpeptidase YcbB [Pelagibacterium halotolerans B2]QJR17760.1 L,D-transpeptidase family protein [Pelagibacterium halotolerans]
MKKFLNSGLKTLLLGAFAGISLLSFSATATAFETVLVDGVQATRIMIAPPRNGLEKTIRDGLRDAMAQAPSGRAADDASQLYYFYGARHFEPLWLTESNDGIAFSGAAEQILTVFKDAYLQGLDPADYLIDMEALDAAANDPAALAALEAEFSASILRYANDAHTGRLDPRSVSGYIDVASKSVDEAELFSAVATASDPAGVLLSYHPTHREFVALRDLLARHYAGEIEDLPPIGEGKLIKLGMLDERVPVLRERMGLRLTPDADPLVYDDELASAVEAFQTTMGLNPDGVVGPATIAAINGANGATRGDIVANMERWRWMPEDLGDFNVFVNIPEFRLDVNREGRSVWNTRVIVGTAKNQTPMFSDMIRHVVTNPYWNVPSSILSAEIFPQVARNPNYIASQNMELLYQGNAIDPWMVDWSRASPSMFRVRQKPGTSNALGQVKFLFPNSHDVYLHDTNARYLFDRSMRALSHGCVRVQDPFGFAEALLQHEPSLTVASLEGTLGGSERWFNMDQQVPVHLAYFTLRIDADGTVRSFSDLYGHNARIIEMLEL